MHTAAPAITGRTRVFLILGDPVEPVRAPELFNALFCQHGVGVGGAGRAIATSLAERGIGHLALFDPEPRRVADFASRLRTAWPLAVVAAASADPAGFYLVVNARPLGLQPDDPLPFDVSRIDAGAAVVDILMKERSTPLLRACHARGLRAWPGLGMMTRQAAEYLAFFGLHDLARAYDPEQAEALL